MFIESYILQEDDHEDTEYVGTILESLDTCWIVKERWVWFIVNYGGMVLVTLVDKRCVDENDVGHVVWCVSIEV